MIDRILRFSNFFLLSSIVIVIFIQVFLRYVMNDSNVWSEELARFLMVYLCFFGSCLAMKQEKGLRVTFFVNKMPPKVSLFIDLLFKFLILIFLCFVIYYGAITSYRLHSQVTPALQWPKSTLYFSLIPPIFLMMLVTLRQLRDIILKLQSTNK